MDEQTMTAYRAATGDGAVLDRSDRVLLPIEGRAPSRMLTGIVSGSMPPELEEVAPGTRKGAAPYSAVLTPKGKLVTDLRLLRLGNGEAGALLLDLPDAGVDHLREHLTRYLPPRFAKMVEPAEPLGLLTVTGRRAAELLAAEVFGLEGEAAALEALGEGEERAVEAGGEPDGEADGDRPVVGLRVVRNGDVSCPAFDLIGPERALRSVRLRLHDLGVAPAGAEVWEVLRLEKGRPAYGVELDRDTLPPEGGIHGRAIDEAKGCYTGQEVIIRIRDRGRVNRHLRGLLLGEVPAPEPGTPLFVEGRARPSGEIRSTARSPRFGQRIALGYVRREAEPPATARLGAPDGPEVGVRALGDDGWELVQGDPGAS